MSTPVKLYATRSSVKSAVTLYNALTEDLAAEASESTPAPRRSKRIKAEDDEGMLPMSSSTEDFGVATRKSERPAKRIKIERTIGVNTEDEAKQRTKSSGSKAPKKQKSIPQSLERPHPAPEHWREQYDVIKSMRARLKAPVDTMGCHRAQDGETDPKVLICCKELPLANSI